MGRNFLDDAQDAFNSAVGQILHFTAVYEPSPRTYAPSLSLSAPDRGSNRLLFAGFVDQIFAKFSTNVRLAAFTLLGIGHNENAAFLVRIWFVVPV
jgi:hypothetical protein